MTRLEKLKDRLKDKYGVRTFDCDGCTDPRPHPGFPYQDLATRLSWHCGYQPRDSWTHLRIPLSPDTWPLVAEDNSGNPIPVEMIPCPGWTVRQSSAPGPCRCPMLVGGGIDHAPGCSRL